MKKKPEVEIKIYLEDDDYFKEHLDNDNIYNTSNNREEDTDSSCDIGGEYYYG